ncbi:396_t:CDS:2 [Ambispora leptoticha]|uniref:3'-5' exonuclease n=1 Tax=Ambispora leptoticha TaxID=144679 RepID=A0A9N8VNJ2_9GLOM|nr:396_t:CDS:2 [Ambispora leptoticha]
MISVLCISNSVIKTKRKSRITHDAEGATVSIEKITRKRTYANLAQFARATKSIKTIKIVNKEYDNGLPTLSYKNDGKYKIEYVRDMGKADELISTNGSKLFGFDMEWRVFPVPPSRVALLQLCDASTIFLFHLSVMGIFPRRLRELMENSSILKVGPNIRADGRKLFRDYKVNCKSLVELGPLGRQVKKDGFINQRKVQSLRTLVEVLLDHQIVKNKKIQKSNWDYWRLSNEQIDYAANDAYATYLLAERIIALQSEQIALDPSISYEIDLCDIYEEMTVIRTITENLTGYL